MRARELIGADFKISPRLPESLNYIYGLRAGCYTFAAILHLHDFADCLNAQDLPAPPPVRGPVASEPQKLCFGPPLPQRVTEFRSKLSSGQLDQVIEGLLYFSNVADPRASAEIRSLLGAAGGWQSRFVDQFHALTALRRQRDPANAPYFREALHGRFSALAAKALQEVRVSPSTSANPNRYPDRGTEPNASRNSCSYDYHAGFRSALGPTSAPITWRR